MFTIAIAGTDRITLIPDFLGSEYILGLEYFSPKIRHFSKPKCNHAKFSDLFNRGSLKVKDEGSISGVLDKTYF